MTSPGRIAQAIQDGSLYVLLFLLPFSKAACEIAFGFLFIGWLLQRLHPATRRQTVWATARLRPLAMAVGAYLLVCAASIVVSDFPWLSARGFVRKWLEYLLFFVVVTDLIAGPGGAGRSEVVRRGLGIMAWSSLCVVLYGIGQEIFISTRPFQYDAAFPYGRMLGPYENPIDLATYLMVALLALLTYTLTCRGWRRRMLWGLLIGLGGCLVRTEAMGAWIGFVAGLLVLVSRPGVIRRYGLILVGLLLLIGGVVLRLSGRLHLALSVLGVGTVDRWVMWQAAIRMVSDRPILGHGLNTFMANYLHYWVGGEQAPRYAHNCFLQVAAETGVLGLATFLWLLGAMAWWWWRAVAAANNPHDPRRLLLLGIGAGLVAFVVQSSMDTNFYSLRQATLFWTFAGMATGLAVGILRHDDETGRRTA
jgi:putative inorganic carbon (HCO3(-)) transporter